MLILKIWAVLFSNITSIDVLIFFFGIIEGLIILYHLEINLKGAEKHVASKKQDKKTEPVLETSTIELSVKEDTKNHKYTINKTYIMITSFITIFPLLGMFGTVASLLVLDMSSDFDAIRDNFFTALTSTAWGIIFAVIFKIVDAVLLSAKTEQVMESLEKID